MDEKALDVSLTSFDRMFLFFTLFVVGGVIMMVELLGTRILAPFFGNTIYTWSSLITVTLVALSIGYFVGGEIADRKPDLRIIYLIILLACLWIILIPLFRPTILMRSNSFSPLFGSLFSAFVLFTPPLILLGMVTPFAIKLETVKLKTLGTTAGSLFAVSTIGSFVGTVLTGFYLIPNFAIDTIILLTAFLLFAMVGLWFISKKEWKLLVSFFFVLALSYSLSQAVVSPELSADTALVYKTQSPYGEIKVVDKVGTRYLLIDNTIQTVMDKGSGRLTSEHLKFVEMSTLFNPSAKDVLIIGLGGGLLSNSLEERGLNVESVEIDPVVKHVAEEYFGYEGVAYVDDGRYFLRHTDKQYDIIIIDAFSPHNVPPHLITSEMFKDVKSNLRRGGVLVIHTVGQRDFRLQRALRLTLETVYPEVHAYAPNPRGFGAVVFFASMEEVNFREVWDYCRDLDCRILKNMIYKEIDIELGRDTKMLQDSYAPAGIWQREANEKSRKAHFSFFGEEVMFS